MPASVRRLVPFVVALVVLILAGIAAAASTEPQVKIDPRDQAWADAIVLASADLGKGWTVDTTGSDDSGSNESSGDSSWCPEGIPDESDLTITGGSASADFTRKDSTSVSSFAYVWQTPDQAQADWDRTLALMPAQIDCLVSLFDTAPTHAVRAVVTAKGAFAFPAVAPRTAAYRIRIVFRSTARVKKRKSPPFVVKFDLILLGSGRASVWLLVDSFGGKVSPAVEQSLAAKMVARMTTDPGPAPA